MVVVKADLKVSELVASMVAAMAVVMVDLKVSELVVDLVVK